MSYSGNAKLKVKSSYVQLVEQYVAISLFLLNFNSQGRERETERLCTMSTVDAIFSCSLYAMTNHIVNFVASIVMP